MKNYLLIISPRGERNVACYTHSEMADCFSRGELAELQAYGKVKTGMSTVIDMVAAAEEFNQKELRA